jgi:hypothetical protein
MHYKSSHAHPSLPKGIIIYNQIFTSPEHIPCAVLSILIDLINPTIIGEEYKYYETLSY